VKSALAALVLAVAAFAGCADQPLWKSEPAAKPAPDSAPARQEMAPEPQAEPEEKPAVVTPEPPAPRYSPQVQAGITAYDDGNHREAAKLLRAALKTKLDSDDQVAAHKYLAFIDCSASRRTQCRNEFRRALKIDPSFDLSPAEAGHPIWGPIFRALKQPPKRKR